MASTTTSPGAADAQKSIAANTSLVNTALSPSSMSQKATATAPFDVDALIDRLMAIGKPNTGISTSITEADIMGLLTAAKDLFMEQPMMLELDPPLYVVGDIHGQFTDLMRIFNKTGFPSTSNYLFLGDYIDRGKMNMEVILLLLAFKVKYPDTFFLLRGNHETQLVNRIYGFYEELNRRYRSTRLYNTFQDIFNVMPLTALISDRILTMHGGLSPDLCTSDTLNILRNIIRPLRDPPNPSLPLDLLWADPDAKTKKFKFSIRGVSCTFGEDVVNTVCQKHGLDLIVRAHQVVQDGYEFFANRKLVTLFSAPHYCGQFDNAASVMFISKELQCQFKVFRPKFPDTKSSKAADYQITTYGKAPA